MQRVATMSDPKRSTSSGAVEQIMRNMTNSIHSSDGQYIQFTPSPTAQDTWNMQAMHTSLPHQPQCMPFMPETAMPSYGMDQYAQQGTHNGPIPFNTYNMPPQPFIYAGEAFDKRLPSSNDLNYVYPAHGVHQDYLYPQEFKYVSNVHVNSLPTPNRTPIIDNVVGNWTPNTSGTYSPFGNTSSFNTSKIFEQVQEVQTLSSKSHSSDGPKEEIKVDEVGASHGPSFQFNRDTKKPRMVAEVKPMRPSYSDVLLKGGPPIISTANAASKPCKQEPSKQKKETKKTQKEAKNEKQGGKALLLNRSNTSNEIKDLSDAKSSAMRSDKAHKESNKGAPNLNRKWASLDNVADTYADFKHDLNDGAKSTKIKSKLDQKASLANGKLQRNKGRNEVADDADLAPAANSAGNNCKADVSQSVNKNTTRKVKSTRISKTYESGDNNNRNSGKRPAKNRKKDNNVPFGIYGQKLFEYLRCWKYIVKFVLWLIHLVADILSLSVHLSKDAGCNFYAWFTINSVIFWESLIAIAKRIKFLTWMYEKFKKEPEKKASMPPPGLASNINMPTTGEEAMKRLLACKGKDPYSILGVTPFCTDADIKNYYKKQAKLVHPDKNQQPGAEEAFKILVHAFNMIGEPDRRASYDRGVVESAQAEQAMTELTELLVQLQQKVEAAANTIRCSACGLRHKRVKVDRPIYAARNCTWCKIHHSAREGDIWAEASCFGFLWYYFACMDGGVYDITEWAACQKDSLKHLKPDSHNVQYRIALGKQPSGSAGGNRRNQHHQQQQQQAANMSFPRTNAERNADLNSFINNLYGQPAADSSAQTQARRKAKKTK